MFIENIFNDEGSAGIDTGDIGHSLRFRSGASAYLSRAFGTPTSQTRGLISLWYKPGWLLGGLCNAVFLATANPATSGLIIGGTGAFGSTYENRLFIRNGGANKDYWNLVFRDPTSWYHIVVSFDTTQGTQADRAKCWVNGVEQTKGGSSLGASEAIGFLASGTQTINGNTASYYGDQYLARFVLMDGQCVQQSTASVSSFGYQNTEINEWVTKSQSAVKAVVDAGGTNSFMLDFDDPNFATYNVGKDFSSKGNHWTPNNFSLTAGTSYDWMLDVPGNSFATLNPIIPSAANITNGNLTSGTTAVRATMNALAYNSKWEVTAGGSAVTAGVISATGTTNTTSVTANKVFAFRLTTAGALDYRNVTDAGSWTSITTGLSGEQYPYSVTQAANWNFGQAPLHASATYQSAAGGYFYDTTTGYKALCQRNMPDQAILNPEKHFDVLLHVGSSSGGSVTGAQFQPDFVWLKNRGVSETHSQIDSVRGGTKALHSDSTGAEVTSAQLITSFNADGYSYGTVLCTNGSNYVDWLWKAGGAPVTNNAGSITSQVSANVEAGFSIVTYTGTGANATVGHGLGRATGLVVVKQRSSGTTENWAVWHSTLANTEYLLLNGTAAKATGATYWNSTTPTTTVFSVGSAADTNESAKDFVAYCFAEIPGFSKIFSYTGNGSTDGPVVQCGFRPKWILIKRTDSANGWFIVDTARNSANVVNQELYPNLSDAEGTNTAVDITSSGFKLRSTDTWKNASGGTYIGIAFADVPAKYSLAR